MLQSCNQAITNKSGLRQRLAGTTARLLRIIIPTTGELLRHLTLDPTRDDQPQTQKMTPAWVQNVPMSRDITLAGC